ncbi:MAG: glycerol kinase GlpK [Pikeienuella sp.]
MAEILAIDQGTTSSRAIRFSADFQPLATAQQEFQQFFPASGWVEHDAEEIWSSTRSMCRKVLTDEVAVIGITNQRETTVVWDRVTGKPVGKAIVWQDRRTADFCDGLRTNGTEPDVVARTGLLLDPYFSATKLRWILDNTAGARAKAEAGELAFGTIDCWLIWNLTGGRVHATDATNAARTMLYNIHKGMWDDELLRLFDIPKVVLPDVRDSAADFGETDPAVLGRAIPIRGVAGDQQAATVGQACFTPGMMKSTYGTGCFALMNTGNSAPSSQNRLLTTIAYQLDGRPTYALEGSIFIAGAVVQWLRDGLGLITGAGETQALAEQADPDARVYMIPAFTGLGAPYWRADARGAIFGLTRDTGPAEFARAALESVAYQTRDLWEAMKADGALSDNANQSVLRVDGGMTASNWTMQALANQLDAPVDRPIVTETTALGAAALAAVGAGMADLDSFAACWALGHRFEPRMDALERAERYGGWTDAVKRLLEE